MKQPTLFTPAKAPKTTEGRKPITSPAASPTSTPRRPEVESRQPSDVGIYELAGPNGPFPRWLCSPHADKRRVEMEVKRLPGPEVTECDDCLNESRRRA
jgi:hypothetical protein